MSGSRAKLFKRSSLVRPTAAASSSAAGTVLNVNPRPLVLLLFICGFGYFTALLKMHKVIGEHLEKNQSESSKEPKHSDFINEKRNSNSISNQNLLDPYPLKMNQSATSFCIPWTDPFDIDEWWTHHPEWIDDHLATNITHSCYNKLNPNSPRFNFLKRVYHAQWHGDCSKLKQILLPSGGLTAGVQRLMISFMYYMIKSNYSEPWTFTKKTDDFEWLWGVKNKTHWAYCEKEDLSCYTLPLTRCPPQYEDKSDDNSTRASSNIYREDKFQKNMGYLDKKLWLVQYIMRYKKAVRQKVVEILHNEYPPIPQPNCTIMHVRRGDAGLRTYPFRRYAAVSEYLEIGNVKPGDHIVLLTDDQSTIREVNTFYPQYNWIYSNRPRNDGAHGGFNGHVPSHDPAYDFVSILCELRMSRPCNKLVHGDSGFIKMLEYDRDFDDKLQMFHLKTRVSKEEVMILGKGAKRGDKMIEMIFANMTDKVKNG